MITETNLITLEASDDDDAAADNALPKKIDKFWASQGHDLKKRSMEPFENAVYKV